MIMLWPTAQLPPTSKTMKILIQPSISGDSETNRPIPTLFDSVRLSGLLLAVLRSSCWPLECAPQQMPIFSLRKTCWVHILEWTLCDVASSRDYFEILMVHRDVLSKLGVPIGTGGGSYVHYCGRTESLFRKELFEEGEAIKLSLVHQSIYENVNGRHWLACQSRAGPSLRGRVWGGDPMGKLERTRRPAVHGSSGTGALEF